MTLNDIYDRVNATYQEEIYYIQINERDVEGNPIEFALVAMKGENAIGVQTYIIKDKEMSPACIFSKALYYLPGWYRIAPCSLTQEVIDYMRKRAEEVK